MARWRLRVTMFLYLSSFWMASCSDLTFSLRGPRRGIEQRAVSVRNARLDRGEEREGGTYLAFPAESWTLARIRLSSSAWSSEASARRSSGWRQCGCLGSEPQEGSASSARNCERGGVGVGGGAWASPGPAPSRKLPDMWEGTGLLLGLGSALPLLLVVAGSAGLSERRGGGGGGDAHRMPRELEGRRVPAADWGRNCSRGEGRGRRGSRRVADVVAGLWGGSRKKERKGKKQEKRREEGD